MITNATNKGSSWAKKATAFVFFFFFLSETFNVRDDLTAVKRSLTFESLLDYFSLKIFSGVKLTFEFAVV